MQLKINRILELIPEWKNKAIKIKPIIGGITNINFMISVDEKKYFLSMKDSKSDILKVNFRNKYYNNNICGQNNLSPNVTHFFESDNLLVTEFYKSDPVSAKLFKNHAKIKDLTEKIKLLHNVRPFLNKFNMFNLIHYYINLINKDYPGKKLFSFLNHIENLEKKLYLPSHEIVPCHNDLVPENILLVNDQIFIVDFDYSGNNDAFFELGNLSVEMNFNELQIIELINCYFGKINEKYISRVYLQGIVSDIGWSLWCFVQEKISNLNFDYKTQAYNRLERAKNKLDSPEFKLWNKYI